MRCSLACWYNAATVITLTGVHDLRELMSMVFIFAMRRQRLSGGRSFENISVFKYHWIFKRGLYLNNLYGQQRNFLHFE